MYTHICVSLSLSLSLSLYIYIYIYVYIYIYIYIYIYEANPDKTMKMVLGKGQMGSALTGSLQTKHVFLTGDFLGTPVSLLLSSQKCRGVAVLPKSAEIRHFRSSPMTAGPIFSATSSSGRPQRSRRTITITIIIIIIIVIVIIIIIMAQPRSARASPKSRCGTSPRGQSIPSAATAPRCRQNKQDSKQNT